MGKVILHGDCLEVLKTLASDSVDALVTDPPAGISFMGKDWDSDKGGREEWITWLTQVMAECKRVLKPGAHALVWSIPRTSHWSATAVENAGFEIRDIVTHLFGQGFPKSLDVSKAIDKKLKGKSWPIRKHVDPSDWAGFGTALKPAAEFWILARKPLGEKTVAANVTKHGTGAINIDGCRVSTGGEVVWKVPPTEKQASSVMIYDKPGTGSDSMFKNKGDRQGTPLGRFPANLVLSHSPHCTDDQCDIECAIRALDGQSGVSKSTDRPRHNKPSENLAMSGANLGHISSGHSDAGGASRFFYCAKISSSERNAGLDRYEIVSVESQAWEGAGQPVQLQVDTASSPPRVIAASGTPNKSVCEWNTLLFGSEPTGQSQANIRSTIKTATSSTIDSPTLSWLLRSNTSASILDASCVAISGGSHALLATQLNASKTSTSAKTDTATSANDALLHGPLLIRSVGALKSTHPTVKPIKLMRYLCKLVTPPGGTVLDPFMGSGSTGMAAVSEGFKFIGIEREPEYVEIAQRRIEYAETQ